MRMSRRALFIGLTSLALAGGTLPACSSSPPVAEASGTVEVFSWWTAGGEADGLNAVIAQFKTAHPNVDFINASEKGGGGTKARETRKARMSANQPPDSFQVHGGKELISSWVKPTGVNDASQSKMEPLDTLFAEQ